MNADRFGIGPVDEALDRLPPLASKQRQHAEPMPGRGNRVYRLRLDGRDFVMRFPGRARFIDVVAEYRNQCRAADAGVAPAAVGLDRNSGAIVSRWLTGGRSDSRAGVDDAALAHCLARVHHATAPFADLIDPHRALEWNLTSRVRTDERVRRLAPRAVDRIRRLPAASPLNCHGDPTSGNVIGGDDDLPVPQLIDWEYSHRGHAAWDLAIACNDRDADTDRAGALLDHYNSAAAGYGATPVEPVALVILRGVTALASAAWLVNHGGDDKDIAETVEYAARWLD